MARLKADIEPHTEQAGELIFKEQDKERLLDDEGQYVEMDEGLEEIIERRYSQKSLSKWIDYTDFKLLFYGEKGGQPDEGKTHSKKGIKRRGRKRKLKFPRRKRLIELMAPKAGFYLYGSTAEWTQERLENGQFLFAARLRVGHPVLARAGHQCFVCAGSTGGRVVDAHGVHAFAGCASGGNRQQRHNMVADIIAETARRSGKSVTRESNISGRGTKREADVLVLHGADQGRRHLCIDVAVTCSEATNSKSSIKVGPELNPTAHVDWYAKEKKDKLNKKVVEVNGRTVYCPMVFNQYGGMNTEGFVVLRAMGARAGRLHNSGPMAHSVGLNSLFTRISACIMRCQEEAVHRRRHPATLVEVWISSSVLTRPLFCSLHSNLGNSNAWGNTVFLENSTQGQPGQWNSNLGATLFAWKQYIRATRATISQHLLPHIFRHHCVIRW